MLKVCSQDWLTWVRAHFCVYVGHLKRWSIKTIALMFIIYNLNRCVSVNLKGSTGDERVGLKLMSGKNDVKNWNWASVIHPERALRFLWHHFPVPLVFFRLIQCLIASLCLCVLYIICCVYATNHLIPFFRSSLTCPHCLKQSNTFDPFLCISLPIPLRQTRWVKLYPTDERSCHWMMQN